MRKFLIIGGLILLFGVTTSNGKKANSPAAKRSDLNATMDSLKQAAHNLESSTERMNNSLSNIK
jgi:hypothetical protein